MNSAIALWITDRKSTLFSIHSWTSFSFIPICHRYSCQRKVFLFVKPSTSPNRNRISRYTDYQIFSNIIIKLSKLYLHVLFRCTVQETIEMEQQQKKKKKTFGIKSIVHTCLINSECKCLRVKVCDEYAEMWRISQDWNNLLLIWTCGFTLFPIFVTYVTKSEWFYIFNLKNTVHISELA